MLELCDNDREASARFHVALAFVFGLSPGSLASEPPLPPRVKLARGGRPAYASAWLPRFVLPLPDSCACNTFLPGSLVPGHAKLALALFDAGLALSSEPADKPSFCRVLEPWPHADATAAGDDDVAAGT